MKKLLFPVVLSAFLIVSCGDDGGNEGEKSDGGEKTEEQNETGDLGEFKAASLDTFDVALDMQLPQYERAMNQMYRPRMEVIEEGMKWKVTIGPEDKERFCLIIEDVYGDYKLAEEEGSELDLIAERKKQLAGYTFLNADYLVDDKDAIMYEVVYEEGSGIEPHFQVMGIVRKGESIYKVYSDDGITTFNKLKAERMLETIRSMSEEVEA